MNEKITDIVEHTSRIDGLLKSEIRSSGRYNTVAPTRGECWESAVCRQPAQNGKRLPIWELGKLRQPGGMSGKGEIVGL